MADFRKCLVVAMAEDRVIGRNNALPWRVQADLRQFRDLTLGKPIIMGRRTFDSIGKPLKGRTNIVISRDASFFVEGVKIAHCFEAALEIARAELPLHESADEEIMVIGGEQIFAMALADADRIYLTEIQARVPGGDAFFPELDSREWRVAKEFQLCAATPETPAAHFKVLDRQLV